jgi:hypothetical protein
MNYKAREEAEGCFSSKERREGKGVPDAKECCRR